MRVTLFKLEYIIIINMKNTINLQVENPDVPFLFYLPQVLDNKLTDIAYRESRASGKRVSKAELCRQALRIFLKENENQTP